ncbi:MAG TPA: hypothetical protein VHA06_07055 [Candidatus Angelobacter sp.]|jgi:hypothetical protein|nr:hypothetical protein [Candidatus Angelobacter sp.]
MAQPIQAEYVFCYNDGKERKFADEAECLESIQGATGLDAVLARMCLNKDGIRHPAGKWLKRKKKSAASSS